jgi:hypothetical protein
VPEEYRSARFGAEFSLLHNPAFVAVVVSEISRGYLEIRKVGMPLPIMVPAYVIATTRPYRSIVPLKSTTTFATWVLNHRRLLIDLPYRCKNLADDVMEGIAFGCSNGSLTLDPEANVLTTMAAFKAAEKFCKDAGIRPLIVGKFLANAGRPSTVFQLLNIRV